MSAVFSVAMPFIRILWRESHSTGVIRFWIDPPKMRVPHIRDSWAETISQQPKEPEHNIGLCAGVCHDFSWIEFRLLFQHHGEQHQAVAQRAGNHYTGESRELIGDEIATRDSVPHAEVFGIGASVNGSNRDHGAQTIGESHLAAAPMVN